MFTFTLKASAREETPAAPMLLCSRSILVMLVLTFKPSAREAIPSSPI